MWVYWQVCGVHYQQGSAVCPQGHRWCRETLSQVYSLGGSLIILYSPFSQDTHLPKYTIKEGGGGGVGKEGEGRVEDKKEESGVQGGEMRGKRREKSSLNSYHCLDVNWSWSRFRWHRKQRVQSAQSERGKGGGGAILRDRTGRLRWGTTVCLRVTHTQADMQKHTKRQKEEIWLEWAQQMHPL